MNELLKVIVLAVLGILIALLLKNGSAELSMLLSIAISFTVLLLVFNILSPVLDFWRELELLSGLSSEVTTPLLKCTGIAVMTKIATDLCRDARETAVASAVELAGTVAALYISLPLLTTAVKLVQGLL